MEPRTVDLQRALFSTANGEPRTVNLLPCSLGSGLVQFRHVLEVDPGDGYNCAVEALLSTPPLRRKRLYQLLLESGSGKDQGRRKRAEIGLFDEDVFLASFDSGLHSRCQPSIHSQSDEPIADWE